MNAELQAIEQDLNRPQPTLVKVEPQQGIKDYTELTTHFDKRHGVAWYYMHGAPRPCFTPTQLAEIKSWYTDIQDRVDSGEEIKYVVAASTVPGVFNLGGDLHLFTDLIGNRDRAGLERYAHACIDVLYMNLVSLERDLTTISLVQGDALGGGFEGAMSSNVLIAERSTKLGLPEIIFNLFPGMGAYSFLSRRIGPQAAERMILSGKIYGAAELHEMGIVDVLAEDGEGERAVYDYIRAEQRSANGIRAMRRVRRSVDPISYEELHDVVQIWVDAALQLSLRDLRMMERLVGRQNQQKVKQSVA
jgi:DSF synthase